MAMDRNTQQRTNYSSYRNFRRVDDYLQGGDLLKMYEEDQRALELKAWLEENNLCVIDNDYHKWRWRLLTLWVIGFTLYMMWTYTSIQNGRKESCERTYAGIREAFQPLFPKQLTVKQLKALKPEDRAVYDKMQHNLITFNNRINFLISNCGKQTKVDT